MELYLQTLSCLAEKHRNNFSIAFTNRVVID